ncbi:hypothetical protein HETIRDRAFT_430478 [Heterobasidion irregulare TC 32-1]|uniref:Uncharacterized protein n=1 Tax=Heterobasidion irregulare (strain TC 32-1) TaxID=747525 RepID=W4JSI5_HETIT|nr:uncharacterized protein HETIRDRAFT_430478 [Heterobasidion irregulare TC 32-1]ETW76075.1 hypothetical protein HETIRDRAFT_430478 [Heterobasidion irregulare TC 32-1]
MVNMLSVGELTQVLPNILWRVVVGWVGTNRVWCKSASSVLVYAVWYLPKAFRIPPLDPSSVGRRLGVGAEKMVWQHCTWIRAHGIWMWESVGNKQWHGKKCWRESVSAKDGGTYRGLCRAPWHGALSGDHNHLPIIDSPATKSLITILLLLCLLVQMPSILPILKAKLAEYMLSLPDGAAEYEDYELWGQGFAHCVALLDRLAHGKDIPELADFIAKAERGLNHMATDNWLVWRVRVLPQRVACFAVKQQKEAKEQALAEETERAAAASRVAAEDYQWRWDVVVGAMFDGSLDPEEDEHQLPELDAKTAVPPPLFFPSPSPDPAPSADAILVSTTVAMNCMSVDPTALIAPIESQGKRAAAVVVEFACQRTPFQGWVIVSLSPGMGCMLTVQSPVERNGAGKMMQDPPGLMPGDANYACQRWMPNKGKSKGKGKLKAKVAEKSGEPEPSCPTKKRKVKVLVPE